MYTLPRHAVLLLLSFLTLFILATDANTEEYIIFPSKNIRSEEVAALTYLIEYYAKRGSVYSELRRSSSIPLFWVAKLSTANFPELEKSPAVN